VKLELNDGKRIAATMLGNAHGQGAFHQGNVRSKLPPAGEITDIE